MQTLFPSLPNLRSDAITLVCPWEFEPASPIPVEVYANKKARNDWINDPATQHNVYSMWEGHNPGLRISGASAKDDGANPPFRLMGIWADYDAKWDPAKGLPTDLAYPPNYICLSMSGNLHAVWLIEAPFILGASQRVTKAFLEELADAMQLQKVWKRWDSGASMKPSQLLTNGLVWTKLDDTVRISTEFLAGIRRKVILKETRMSTQNVAKFEGANREKIVEALKAKYPRFSEWPGEFVVGAQGPSFWIEGSVSPMSAVVKDDGIYTFSDHASKPWWSWAEIVGGSLVHEIDTERVGRAIEGVWFDGHSYWYENTVTGKWNASSKDQIRRHLIEYRGLSSKQAKGANLAEVDTALAFIEDANRIEQAALYPFREPGVFFDDAVKDRALNMLDLRPVQPAEEPGQVWGPDGNFPWISGFLGNFLNSPEALESLLAWMKHAYSTSLEMNPQSGQAIFLVGGPSLGKTFFSNRLFGGLMGGFVPAEDYFVGGSEFNSELFEAGVWTVDDASIANDKRAREAFADKVKSVVANPTQRCHPKFLKATKVRWQGRLITTLNTDPKSLRMLPVVDGTLLDKICLYRLNDKAKPDFRSNGENEAILAKELPFFGRWLLDHPTPEQLKGDPRFGIKSHLDSELYRAARVNSPEAAIREILIEWLGEYFKNTPEKKAWEGSSRQLRVHLKAIADDEFRYCSPADLDGYLIRFSSQSFPYEIAHEDKDSSTRIWTIAKPTKK